MPCACARSSTRLAPPTTAGCACAACVKSIAGTLVTLVGGRRVAFGAAQQVTGLAPGIAVRGRGRKLEGGLVVASELSAADIGANAKLAPCEFELQVAPVQDFSVGNAKIVFDDARAFFWGGSYRLEHGMRLGAVRSGCALKDDYALHVSASWGPRSNARSRYLGVLRGTLGFEAPLMVPDDLPAGVRLEVALYGFDCDFPKDIQVCDDGQLIYERTSALSCARMATGPTPPTTATSSRSRTARLAISMWLSSRGSWHRSCPARVSSAWATRSRAASQPTRSAASSCRARASRSTTTCRPKPTREASSRPMRTASTTATPTTLLRGSRPSSPMGCPAAGTTGCPGMRTRLRRPRRATTAASLTPVARSSLSTSSCQRTRWAARPAADWSRSSSRTAWARRTPPR